MKAFFALVRDRTATTLIEFAIVGSALLLLIMGGFELTYYYWVQSVLDVATAEAARQLSNVNSSVRTYSSSAFGQFFCTLMNPVDCGLTAIWITDLNPQDFSSYQVKSSNSAATYQTGQEGDFIVIEVHWQPTVPLWPLDTITISSSYAYENE